MTPIRLLADMNISPKTVDALRQQGWDIIRVQDHLTEIGVLTIDEEYTGYQAVIRALLLDRIRGLRFEFAGDDIRIARIGKKSPAHRAAIRVTRRQARADKTPMVEELLEVC